MWTRRQSIKAAAAFGLAAGVSGFSGAGLADSGKRKTINDLLSGNLTPVHDPSIIQQDGVFHLFSTSQLHEAPGLIHWRTSPDLVTWTLKGAVMQTLPSWTNEVVPGAAGAWAPDISFSQGQYRLYYALSVMGSNTSAIGLLTTPTLDTNDPAFAWKDEGVVYTSDVHDDFNAIDPNAFTDEDGRQWLSFGSFWSGLKMIELDPLTGKPKSSKAELIRLARRPFPDAVEAPFVIKRDKFYYLFASYDFCCRGADSSYYTVVGRSEAVMGPYAGRDGVKLLNNGGLMVLNAELDSSHRFRGPGGVSTLEVEDRHYIVYHAYDAQNNGVPTLRIAHLAWTADGWPVAI